MKFNIIKPLLICKNNFLVLVQNILADKNVQKSIGTLLYDQGRLRLCIAILFLHLKNPDLALYKSSL